MSTLSADTFVTGSRDATIGRWRYHDDDRARLHGD